MTPPPAVGRAATISPDGIYRYDLVRHWPWPGKLLMWVMLNPSKADAAVDDPTIRKCMGFARRWGYRGIVVVNLFALRATNPTELVGHPHPIGPDNDQTIRGWATDPQVGAVVEAWGADPMAAYRGVVGRTLRDLRPDDPPFCLGSTKSGAPCHPCRLPYSTVTARRP